MITSTSILAPAPEWVDVDTALAIIRDPRWSWVRNVPCKYIGLRIDTRDGRAYLTDRDGNPITLRDLSRQLDDHLT